MNSLLCVWDDNSHVCSAACWRQIWSFFMFKATFILENGNLFWTRKRKQNVQGVKPRTSTSTLLHLNAFRRSFDFLGVNICVRVGRVVGWMRTTPYGDNEKEASLGGTASVCPRVVCVWVCAYMCLRVCPHVCVCVCVCVSRRALGHYGTS